MLHAQIESCGWFFSSHFHATSRNPWGYSRPSRSDAHAANGSAHWHSSDSHAAFACLIQTRLESTPGITHWKSSIAGCRPGSRSSPATTVETRPACSSMSSR